MFVGAKANSDGHVCSCTKSFGGARRANDAKLLGNNLRTEMTAGHMQTSNRIATAVFWSFVLQMTLCHCQAKDRQVISWESHTQAQHQQQHQPDEQQGILPLFPFAQCLLSCDIEFALAQTR